MVPGKAVESTTSVKNRLSIQHFKGGGREGKKLLLAKKKRT